MAVIPQPRSTRNCTALLAYMIEGESHDGSEGARAVFVSGVNCLPESGPAAAAQMLATRQRWGKDNPRFVEALHVLQSFSAEEFDPNDLDAIEQAHELGLEFAQELWPDREVVVATQIDGVSGLVHNHIAINSPSRENGRSLRGQQRSLQFLRRTNDLVLARHGLDNEGLMARARKRNREQPRPKLTALDLKKREEGRYVWTDDMRERLMKACEAAEPDADEQRNRELFEKAALDQGVDVAYRSKARNSSYAFVDANGKRRLVRGKNLGSAWTTDGVARQLAEVAARKQAERQALQPTPPTFEEVAEWGLDFGPLLGEIEVSAEDEAMLATITASAARQSDPQVPVTTWEGQMPAAGSRVPHTIVEAPQQPESVDAPRLAVGVPDEVEPGLVEDITRRQAERRRQTARDLDEQSRVDPRRAEYDALAKELAGAGFSRSREIEVRMAELRSELGMERRVSDQFLASGSPGLSPRPNRAPGRHERDTFGR